jgi:hypothetical protein
MSRPGQRATILDVAFKVDGNRRSAGVPALVGNASEATYTEDFG